MLDTLKIGDMQFYILICTRFCQREGKYFDKTVGHFRALLQGDPFKMSQTSDVAPCKRRFHLSNLLRSSVNVTDEINLMYWHDAFSFHLLFAR